MRNEISSLTNEQKVQLLEALAISPGWQIMQEWLEREIESEDLLINTVNPEHNKVVYTEKDVHILNKANLIAMKDKPAEFIRTLRDVSPRGPTLEEALKDINAISLTQQDTRPL